MIVHDCVLELRLDWTLFQTHDQLSGSDVGQCRIGVDLRPAPGQEDLAYLLT